MTGIATRKILENHNINNNGDFLFNISTGNNTDNDLLTTTVNNLAPIQITTTITLTIGIMQVFK
jgi:hypothetical protein